MGFFSDIGDTVTDTYKGLTGETAASAATQGAATTAAAEQASLDSFKEANATSQAYRDAGLTKLGALSGFDETGAYTGDFSAQNALIEQTRSTPMFQSQLAQGDEAIARSASAAGGLRTGGTVEDLASFESNLLNKAYNQQVGNIQGLAQLPNTSLQTAQMTAAPGITTGQGQVAAGQAKTDAWGNIISGASSAYMMSDERMKDNINKISDTSHPEINMYEWDWRKESGKEGYETGFIAQEVEKIWPELVIDGEDGIKRINKDKIEERLNGSING